MQPYTTVSQSLIITIQKLTSTAASYKGLTHNALATPAPDRPISLPGLRPHLGRVLGSKRAILNAADSISFACEISLKQFYHCADTRGLQMRKHLAQQPLRVWDPLLLTGPEPSDFVNCPLSAKPRH